jgi:hypothetical protein
VVAAIEVVVDRVCPRNDEAWGLAHRKHSAHHPFAYDSCASDATFQKVDASNEDIAQPFKQLLVHPILHARCMKFEKRKLDTEDLLIFAFFSRSSMLGILPAPQAPIEAKTTLPERQREGKSKHTLPPAS